MNRRRSNRMHSAIIVGAAALAASALGFGSDRVAHADSGGADAGSVQAVYGNVGADQVEVLSTADRIMSVAANGAPMAIWEALEHGESVECMQCIPSVAPLLYAGDAKTREIAAWWLRRRTFGVMGDGEVYQSTITTLQTDTNPLRRAYAASALGEFLVFNGVTPVATALTGDADPGVRAAAASALGRLNDDGAGAIGKAMADSAPSVKLAALASATLINSYADAVSVVKLLGDADAGVRRRTAETLEALSATGAAPSLASIAQNDADPGVRLAACHALGAVGDASDTAALDAIAANDSSGLVRDMAKMALLRL